MSVTTLRISDQRLRIHEFVVVVRCVCTSWDQRGQSNDDCPVIVCLIVWDKDLDNMLHCAMCFDMSMGEHADQHKQKRPGRYGLKHKSNLNEPVRQCHVWQR